MVSKDQAAHLRASHFEVCGRKIGEGLQPYLVAEMACAHQGDANVALAMVDLAVKAQVDALQIQIFSADRLVSCKHPAFSQAEALTIDYAKWTEIIDRARSASLPIWANVFSTRDLEFAASSGAAAIKLHSTDLSNLDLLALAATTELPVSLSVGASTLAEIDGAINAMSRSGSPPALLMHGFQAFPTPIDQNHVRFISTLKESFGLPVGFQDHAARDDEFARILPMMAIAAGAALVEKHFTYAENVSDVDHESSLGPEAFRSFVGLFRQAAAALGLKEEHTFTSSELEYRARMKKCLVAAVDLPAGHRLGASDVVLLRAAQPRLAPDQLFEWLGKSLTVSVTAGDPIAPEHFQGECR